MIFVVLQGFQKGFSFTLFKLQLTSNNKRTIKGDMLNKEYDHTAKTMPWSMVFYTINNSSYLSLKVYYTEPMFIKTVKVQHFQ